MAVMKAQDIAPVACAAMVASALLWYCQYEYQVDVQMRWSYAQIKEIESVTQRDLQPQASASAVLRRGVDLGLLKALCT